MNESRSAARLAVTAAAIGLSALAGAGTATAHVHVQPEQAEQGGTAKVTFRVPNERPDAGTVRVHVALPLEHPLSSVRTRPLPGWTAQVQKVRLDRPVNVAGAEVTEAVSGITWTARPGTRIAPDQFEEFEATLGTLLTDTGEVLLPAEQTYDSGEVVRWDQSQGPDGSEPERPAPSLQLLPATEEHSHGAPADSAAPSSGEPAPASDDTARVLGGAGLLVGALGLGVGIGALLRGRRGRADS